MYIIPAKRSETNTSTKNKGGSRIRLERDAACFLDGPFNSWLQPQTIATVTHVSSFEVGAAERPGAYGAGAGDHVADLGDDASNSHRAERCRGLGNRTRA